MGEMKTIKATTLLNLLKNKHSKDLCVHECKNGPTWTSNKVKRFDLWVMKRSYTEPMTLIYEIKVSRQDFLQDDKYQTYLPYCTDFYFVAPPGIIIPDEVPVEAGLLISSKNATMLYCKKKAPHRNIEIPVGVYKYILMSRTRIVDGYEQKQDQREYWRNWLENKKENQKLGYNVSRKIRQLYDKNVQEVKVRQNRLDIQIEKLEGVKYILNELGFNENNLGWEYEEKVKARIAEINAGFPEKDVLEHLEKARLNLTNTIKVIKGV